MKGGPLLTQEHEVYELPNLALFDDHLALTRCGVGDVVTLITRHILQV
jgi:hypothetical protein